MNKIRLFSRLFGSLLALNSAVVSAQTSSFTIKNRTALWLKAADVEYDTAGGNVISYWGDGSSKGTNSIDSVFGAVNFVRKGMNMHPVVNFDAATQYLVAKGFEFNNPKSAELFVVYHNKAASNLATTGQRAPFSLWGTGSGGDHITWSDYNRYNSWGSNVRKSWSWNSRSYTTAGFDPLYPSIQNISSRAGRWEYNSITHILGVPKQEFFGTNSNTVSWNSNKAVMAQIGLNYLGDIAEVIVYDTSLNLDQKRKVRSYLSVKYGMMMDSIHYASNGTEIFNPNTVGTQKFQVFTIGRDDAYGLKQKQSGGNEDVDGTGLIIGIGELQGINEENSASFASDKAYFSWSHNFLPAGYRTTLSGSSGVSVNNRLSRIWKVSEVGSIGKVTVALPAALSFGDTVYLVVSNDSTFNSSDKFVVGVLKQIDGVNHYVFTYDFANGDYFSFATDVKAPGGVSNGLAWWFAGDKGVYTDNKGLVYRWTDLGPNGMDVRQATPSRRPNGQSTYKNFNQAVRFFGSQNLASALGLHKIGTAYTAFTDVMSVYNNSASSFQTLYGEQIRFSSTNTTAYYQFLNLPQDANTLRWGINYSAGTSLYPSYNNTLNAYTTQIFSGIYNAGSTPKSIALNINGSAGITPTTGAITFYGANSPLYIGSINASANWFSGVINEMAHYDRALSAAEVNRIETYMAIKWAKPMNASYVASNGDTIWSLPKNNQYKRYLVGIGRDDASGLDQRMSVIQRVSSPIDYIGSDDNKFLSDLVAIGLDTITESNTKHPTQFTKNNSFLLWGCDNGAHEYTRSISGASGVKVNRRMERVYRVWETGTVGTVMVRVPMIVNHGQTTYLVISSDTAFNSTDKFVELKSLSDEDGVYGYMYAKVDFADGDYFTIATFKGFPGGVSNKLGYWFTPTSGLRVYNDAHNYVELMDLSGNGFHMEREDWSTLSKAPKTGYANFNRTLNYNGAEGLWSNKGSFWANRAANTVTEYSQLVSAYWPSQNTSVILGDANNLGYFVNWLWTDRYHVGVYNGSARSHGSYTEGTWASVNTGTNILSNQYKSTTPQVRQLFANGSNIASVLNTASAFGKNSGLYSLALGGRAAVNAAPDAWYWKGTINEVVMYDRSISDFERQKIESYLAIKWGKALAEGSTYYTSSGTKVWDPSRAGAKYNNFVFGIARDDNGNLDQKQSSNWDSYEKGHFYLQFALGEFADYNRTNSNVFTADSSYMLVGFSGTGRVGWQDTESFRNDRWRLNREWFVQEKGTIGKVTLSIPADNGSYTGNQLPPNVGNAKLWVDNDGDFSTGVTEYEMTLVNGYWNVQVDLNDGQYFTFASYVDSSDFDKDGVADIYDIDDDNDGLLDKEEGQSPRFTNISERVTTAGKQSFKASTANSATTIEVNVTGANQPGLLFATGNDRSQEFRIYDTDRTGTDFNYKFSAKVQSAFNLHNVIFRPASSNLSTSLSNEPANINLKWRGGIPAIVRNPSNQINIADGTIIFPNTIITQSAALTFVKADWSIEFLLDDTTDFVFDVEVLGTSTTNMAYEAWAVGTTLSDDIDRDGFPNKRDLDADGDGCFDAFEGSIVADKITSLAPKPYGKNGLSDSLEINDGLLTSTKISSTVYVALNRNINMCADSDNDGIVDLQDIDDDNDGITDFQELACNNALFKYIGSAGIASGNPSGASNIWGYYLNNQDTVDLTVKFSRLLSFTSTNYDQGNGLHYSVSDNDAAGYQTEFFLVPRENETTLQNPGFGKIEFGPNVPKSTINTNQNIDKQAIILKWYPNVPAYIYDPQGQTNNGHMSVLKNGDTLFTKADRTLATSTWKLVFDPNRYDDSFYLNTIHIDKSGTNLGIESFGLAVNTCSILDLDNDFVPNHLDLDSDGDGCSDAFESGASTNKLDTIVAGPYGNNGYSNNLETSDSVSAVAKFRTSYMNALNSDVVACLDSDGDGVVDVIDIDDDNDGILDAEETGLAGGVFVQDGTIVTTANAQEIKATVNVGSAKAFVKILHFGAGAALNAATVQFLDGLHYTSSDNDAAFSQTIKVTPEYGSYINEIRFGPNMPKNPNSSVVNDKQRIKLTWLPDAIAVVVDPNNQIANFASDDTLKSGDVLEFTSTVTASAATWYIRFLTPNMTNEFFLISNHEATSVANFSTEAFGLDMDLGYYEDTDEDKINDYLDTDSDNDGCGDAQESGAVLSGMTVPSPYGDNGLSNSIETNDTRGANTTFASSSYLAYSATNGCGDTDNDGVRDLDDLDDDNDGITDYNELDCGQGVFSRSYILNYANDKAIGGNFGLGNFLTSAQIRFKNLTSLVSSTDASEGVHYLVNDGNKSYDLALTISPVSSTAMSNIEFGPFLSGSKNGAQNNAAQDITLTWNPSVVAYVYDPDNQLSSHADGVPIKSGVKLKQNSAGACSTLTWKVIFYTNYISKPVKINATFETTAASFSSEAYSIKVHLCNGKKDSDKDGKLNSLDNDSDGDGCSDAVEAGHLKTNAYTDTYIPGPYGANGLSSSVENSDSIYAINTFTPASWYLDKKQNYCLDNDGDGLNDINDLDDDNDGILDEIECPTKVKNSNMTWLIRERNSKRMIYDLLSADGDTIARATFDAVSLVNFSGANITSDNTFVGEIIDLGSGNKVPRIFTAKFEPVSSKAINLSIFMKEGGNGRFWFHPRSVKWDYGTAGMGVIASIPQPKYLKEKYKVGDTLFGLEPISTAHRGLDASTNKEFINVLVSGSATKEKPLVITSNYYPLQWGFGGENYAFRVLDIEQSEVASVACDTDGDGIPDSLDPDSDGDGCNDVVEAGHFKFKSTSDDTIPGNSGVNGYSELVETNDSFNTQSTYVNLNYWQNKDIQICDDFDNDGIIDFIDIDDDNDGIRDDDECPIINVVANGDFEGQVGTSNNLNSTAGPGWINAAGNPDLFATPVPTTGNGTAATNGGFADGLPSSPNGGNIVGASDMVLGGEAFKRTISGLEIGKKYTLSFHYANAGVAGSTKGGDTGRIAWDVHTDLAGAVKESFRTPFLPYLREGKQRWVYYWVEFTATKNAHVFQFSVDNGILGEPASKSNVRYAAIDGIKIVKSVRDCDTDGDGKPDHLDLDADGDGCFDAKEAGHSKPVSKDGTISGPYGSNGLAVSVEYNDADTTTIKYIVLGDFQDKDVHVPCDSYIDTFSISNGACTDTIFTFDVNFKYFKTSGKYIVWDLTHDSPIDTFTVSSSADLPKTVKYRRQMLKKTDVIFYVSDFNKPLVTSNMDTITVIPCNLPKPIISVKPANAASCSGDSVRMVVNVKAVGISSWYYQWYKNGVSLNGETDSVLSVRYTTALDSGFYYAKVGETPLDTLWSDTVKIVIHPKPVADFTINDTLACVPVDILDFKNKSTLSKGTMTYSWTFGDGGSSTNTDPSYQYGSSALGTQTVTLITTSDKGCKDTAIQTVQVGKDPTSVFSVNTGTQCLGWNSFVFDNQSTVAAGSGTPRYKWEFGNGDTSNVFEPTYKFSNSGTFTIKLTTTSGQGCIISSTTNVTVNDGPVASFKVDFDTQCLSGNNFKISDLSTLVGSASNTYEYEFGDATNSTAQNPNKTYTSVGQYTIEQVATSANGCTDTFVKNVWVINNISAPVIVNLGKDTLVQSSTKLTVSPNVIGYTYTWSNNVVDDTITVSTAGNYTVTASTPNGCSVTSAAKDIYEVTSADDSDSDGIKNSDEGFPGDDTDSDGIPDYLDLDSDDDGIPDSIEKGSGSTPVDTDGDGIPDFQDLDSDGDGISDNVEAGSDPTKPVDTDGDGKPDYLDLDSDADGISDSEETDDDADSDGNGNYIDLDSDGDGIPDSIEKGSGSTPVDTDGDGTPDYLDLDSDGDGIPDKTEAGSDPTKPVDTDGDGTPDFQDTDSDADGISDATEKGTGSSTPVDTDGDGTPDYQDADSDGDGIPDSIEKGSGSTPVDTDGDGTPDYLDLDSDGDGIPDKIEAGSDPTKPVDTDGDGIPDFRETDSDNDGILDKDEAGSDLNNPVDTDKDGKPDFQDTDSDNDGISDSIEKGSGSTPVDTDGDGTPDFQDLDSDGDGIPDSIEKGSGSTPVDTDGDGTPDYLDLDSDGDGIPDSLEAGADPTKPVDTDGDGTPDYRDLDSDNDGISDKVEAGSDPTKPVDTDGDGTPDFRDLDSDADGIEDKVEGNIDTDKDGKPDYQDVDSDGDGIPDSVEKGSGSTPVDTDGDGTPDYLDTDSDGDGILDADEAGADPTKPVDTDKDGTPDYLDLDSDNDGIDDKTEGDTDTDGDGIPNYRDTDSDGDGIPDSVEKGSGSTPVDTDNDGTPDYLDTDSDGDGISDTIEAGANGGSPVDTDGDGTPDYRDLDSDADGISDAQEGNVDTDGDGVPNFRDTDSDGDGILDKTEGTTDSDGDNKPDYLDTDSDGDGIPDAVEGTKDTDGDGTPDYLDTDSDGDGIDDADEAGSDPTKPVDTDGDGIPDYRDLDSDGDGIDDKVEGEADADGDGVPNYRDTDSDGDGILDSTEKGSGTTPVDTDGDGKPDYLDTDSDNDGISDSIEKGSGSTPLDTDSDGIPDYQDTDSDGDGISDKVEGTDDTDGDGVPNYRDKDSDGDGIPDSVEKGSGSTPVDTDGDGTPDYLDTDSDGDGIPDKLEGNVDTDGDGTPDYLDTDSDGDGISDTIEAGSDPTKPLDTDGDGTPDFKDTDSDNDGIDDKTEGTVDTDGDGIPNYRDTDSDNDGIDDITEGNVDTDKDGKPDYVDTDSDNDGIDDKTEGNIDTDGDGTPNYRDLDSDDDGISDANEGNTDTDGDGTPNYLDTDSDGDGIPDSVEKGSGSLPVDTDGDGIPDYLDTDSDNDGIPDSIEKGSGSSPLDTDGDGIPDYRDTDSDNDGIDDKTEGTTDTDGDGIPNYRDTDSDGDGIDDKTEGTSDTDGDGKPDYVDTDSDGDGISDAIEGTKDSDGDGTPDYKDLDSDGDGISDAIEGSGDDDGDGIPNFRDDDSDNDGIKDIDEGSGDTDGDGIPDYKDTDSDNDGILDSVEKGSGAKPVDTDGDGTPDYKDLDSDGDGIDDKTEGNIDSDGDGKPDYIDTDSDGDGIPDSIEKGSGSTPVDTDGDGTPDYKDLDSDGDGIPDSIEKGSGSTPVDTDGDGTPDYLDTDSDGDGISDNTEAGADPSKPLDTDGDGTPDFRDLDSDDDGISDKIEGTTDTDGDGIPNYRDTDSDGDGISDKIEGTGDTDKDGTPDYLDTDSDGDGISDAIEKGSGSTPVDTDGDGVPDYKDLDSDGDGISDAIEKGSGSTPVDTDGDGTPDYLDLDSDGDGIPDAIEKGSGSTPVDTDGDGTPDYLDTDSDGDGIPDSVEKGSGTTPVDTDGDGTPDYLDTDSDNDGITDKDEAGANPSKPIDTDGDGIPDYLDLDSDDDGISDKIEGNTDADGDGIPNYRDLDSDGDGIDDKTEGVVDTDGDGVSNYLDSDSDGDGIPDSVEKGSGSTPVDTDGDGTPDYLDLDSDGDGIPDSVEGTTDTDGDGIPDYLDTDSDNDGISDKEEAGINPSKPVDTDGDGIPDYRDLDSDGDGISDKTEGNVDTDNDGTPDYRDLDSDGDNIPDSVEKGSGTTPVDTDGDGTPDYLDTDSDGDGINDTIEAGADPTKPVDTDGDGIPDYRELDSDNDGIPDSVEKGSGSTPVDTDGDGIPDYLDTDSDGDGIPDSVEKGADGSKPVDTDGDGIPDYLDTDSDGDGIKDSVEAGADPTKPVDTDGDGTPDYLDTDSDNDGISDKTEGTSDTDGDGTPDYRDLDSDNDGISDNIEGSTDTDGDGVGDWRDTDSDNDGIDDKTEGTNDPDGDGIGNWRDLDSDGDGIPDSIEKGSGSNPVDTDGDGIPDYLDTDSDGDGIPDSIEKGSNGNNPVDTDGDGIPDYLDLDSDNDGITDAVEKGPNGNNPLDTDGDGIADYLETDSDNDGISDTIEAGSDKDNPVDSDNDGFPDYRDLDSDNDGIPDSVEKGSGANPVDTDGDGIPDYLDLDSDNDGIPDSVEKGADGNNPIDTDGDGTPDYLDLDSDNDGIPDAVEKGADGNNPVDTDGDGTPDYRDLDSDNDGIPDSVEKGANGNNPVDSDGDGIPDYLDVDSDNDGIPDSVEKGADGNNPVDTDGDGTPDYLDLDSDNDGIPDSVEKGADGNNPLDTDGDGIPDYLDTDSDNDGLPDSFEAGADGDNPQDTDGDGIPDYRDLDSDNDGINDEVEAGDDPLNPVDTDGDGILDIYDEDSDGDGLLDSEEAGDDPDFAEDTDNDGIPDFRDLDSDNDGVLDEDEFLGDCDGDGIPNVRDEDPCEPIIPNGFSPNGDGVNDFFVIPGIQAFKNNNVKIFNRWGNVVFEADGYYNEWDGKANRGNSILSTDGRVPDGTYFYVVDLGDGTKPRAGSVYINRLKK